MRWTPSGAMRADRGLGGARAASSATTTSCHGRAAHVPHVRAATNDPMTVAPPWRRELRGQGTDAAEHPGDQDRRCRLTGTSAQTARCAVMPGIPRHAPSSVSNFARQRDGLLGRHGGELRRGVERPVRLRTTHPHALADAPGSTPSPTASTTPEPSLRDDRAGDGNDHAPKPG